MKKILCVIDMQNDFITGTLGTKEAEGILERVRGKMATYDKKNIVATQDTHDTNYFNTQEGKKLPVEHCIKGGEGWEIHSTLQPFLLAEQIFEKNTFGSEQLADFLKAEYEKESFVLEMVGLCTDICVVSNALLCKAKIPELEIEVDGDCCAGVTTESHQKALDTMRMCQINIV